MGISLRKLFKQRRGNFGHKGRPGKVGGSSGEGGMNGDFSSITEEYEGVTVTNNVYMRDGYKVSQQIVDKPGSREKFFRVFQTDEENNPIEELEPIHPEYDKLVKEFTRSKRDYEDNM